MQRRKPRADPPLPNFLIIGAQKSATRWLRTNLGQHPDIYAVERELWFFNDINHRYTKRGLPWYRAQFDGWSGERFVGEATPGYMILRHDPGIVADRIQEVVPDVRLIAVLRNPVDRAQSAMVHMIKRNRIPPDADLLELVRNPPPRVVRMGIVNGGLYAESLQPYVDRFGDQLLIQLHDDVQTQPVDVYRTAVAHIGASTDYVPKHLDRVRYSNQSGSEKKRPISDEARLEIYEHFRDDVARLEQMLGRDLSAWDPAVRERSA